MKKVINQVSHICEVRIGYFPKIDPRQADSFTNSATVEGYVRPFMENYEIYQKEYFVAVYTNRNNKPLGIIKVSEGAASSCVVDVQYILRGAILTNAQGLIIAHNHPSGAVKPSAQDLQITDKIKSACEVMDIKLYDHLIISPFGGYYSFADNGHNI